jgi:hypothetical protein
VAPATSAILGVELTSRSLPRARAKLHVHTSFESAQSFEARRESFALVQRPEFVGSKIQGVNTCQSDGVCRR